MMKTGKLTSLQILQKELWRIWNWSEVNLPDPDGWEDRF